MPTDGDRVKQIFLEAAEQPDEAARVAYLDRACGGDNALRDRVEALFRAHDRAGSFLDVPAAVIPDLAVAETMAFSSSDPDGGGHRPDPDDKFACLHILSPSARPDSLGRIGHYEVLEVLGKGGFGIVFRAFDETLQRVVAIKVLAPELAVTSPARKRFLREARSSAKVRHENVVTVYAVEERPLPNLVMEFIPGETLQQRLDRIGPLETKEVIQFGRQIAEGLAAAHAQGLIHRDIKPGNILIEASLSPHVKITDFGLARAADDASVTQSGYVAGTPMYMAPEQAQGDNLDHRADLFSLGSVLYAMCSGRPPFRANSTLAVLKRVVEDTPRPIPEIIPEVPQWLCDIITRLHAKLPADRIGTAREVADLLGRGLAAMTGPVHVAPLPDPMAVTVRTAAAMARMRERHALAKTERIPDYKPARAPQFHRYRLAAAAAAFLALVGGLGITEATGVTDVRGTVIHLLSAEGTLVVEVDDPGVSVRIDGSDVVITGAGVKELRLRPGRYTVAASKNGKLVQQELVTVTRNGRQVVRVSHELPPASTTSETSVAARSADVAAWERVVAALSAAEQVKAVGARLKELNPGFDGALVPTIENGVVRELEINPEDVTDISPVRVLTRLRSLRCLGKGGHSPLADLSPLSGLPLNTLVLGGDQLTDLSPLQGMPLTSLTCFAKLVDDLSPLRGMKLRYLRFENGRVSDISPLKGMPLETLTVWGKVYDLSPLKGMKLVTLHLPGIKTDDLTPLSDMMTLNNLSISDTAISDLSALKGLKLTVLNVAGTQVSDLSPLKGMKLTWMTCSGANVSDLSALNGMPLRELNVAGTKVSDASLAQLKDCKDLIHLILANTQVSDAGLTHLKDLKNLKMLQLYGSKVSDLLPLKEMSLELIMLTPKDVSTQGLDLLRGMTCLKTIGPNPWGLLPAAEFWARYEKGEFK
jgi:Leucine-rich repeat (LRR) protein